MPLASLDLSEKRGIILLSRFPFAHGHFSCGSDCQSAFDLTFARGPRSKDGKEHTYWSLVETYGELFGAVVDVLLYDLTSTAHGSFRHRATRYTPRVCECAGRILARGEAGRDRR
jgi:hypothetical protein